MTTGSENGGATPSLWERIAAPAPVRPGLTHARIAEAAVSVADEQGLDAVSMRTLATRLGVTAMALYRYVSGKDELFELMADAVAGELLEPPGSPGRPDGPQDWRTALRERAYRQRGVLLRHSWLSQLFSLSIPLTPNVLAAVEQSMGTLDALNLGLDADATMAMIHTVDAYVAGVTMAEVRVARSMRRNGWETGADLRAANSERMTWLMSTGRYPVFRRWTREATRKDDAGWQFAFGLDCVLDGVAARLGLL